MKSILIVVDMQIDFIDGALGTKEAVAIADKVADKIRTFSKERIFVTLDTHGDNYLQTLEGKLLPVPHCIKGTKGWEPAPAILEAIKEVKPSETERIPISCSQVNFRNRKAPMELLNALEGTQIFEKPGFGSDSLVRHVRELWEKEPFEIELVGLCTDICVVTNALMIRGALPGAVMRVDASCCAGVTPEKHEAALETLRSCQIEVV